MNADELEGSSAARDWSRMRRRCRFCRKEFSKYEHLLHGEFQADGDSVAHQVLDTPLFDVTGNKVVAEWGNQTDLDALGTNGATWSTLAHDNICSLNSASLSFDYPDQEPTRAMPFDETEDMLQYLFPSPLGWSISNTPSMGLDNMPHPLLNSNRNIADAEGVPADNSSPQALVQLDALIEDAVSTVHRD
ncbi:hypothetical protein LTS17_003752 [Exophiala oligosperma]